MKRVVVPIDNAENVTLFGEHYDVVDGEIFVSDEVAEQVLTEPNLQHAAGDGKRWVVLDERADEPINESDGDNEANPEGDDTDLPPATDEPKPINLGKGKNKK